MLTEHQRAMLVKEILFRLGMLIGAGASAILILMYMALYPKFSDRHDAIFIGAMATFLSVVASSIAYYQAKIVRDTNEDARQRRKLANRARLPAALEEIMRYAEASATFVDYISQLPHETALTRTQDDAPLVQNDAILILQNCIESSDPNIAIRLADLLSEIQCQNSRMTNMSRGPSSTRRPSLNPHNLDRYISDSLIIYMIVYNLFGYARREREDFDPIDNQLVGSALRLCHVNLDRHPHVRSNLERYIRRSREL